jgi:hypothetical protein
MSAPPPLDRTDRLLAAGLVLYAGTLLAVMAAGGAGLTQDDGFYYFKIAQNLAAGRGSTFDGLHGTNGYHPLWLLVLSVVFALQPDPGRALVAGNALMVVLGALAVPAVYLAARLTLGRAGALAAALLWLGFTYSIALAGVEFPLHALLVMLVAFVFLRGRASLTPRPALALGLLLALSCLARLDCTALVAVLGAVVLWRTRGRGQAPWLLLAPPAATLLAYAAVNAGLFGLSFPVSGAVKRSWSAYLLHHDPLYARGGWLLAKAWMLRPWQRGRGTPLWALLAGAVGVPLLAALPLWRGPALLTCVHERVLVPWRPFVLFAAVQFAAYLVLYHRYHVFTLWYYVVQPLLAALVAGAVLDWLWRAGGAARGARRALVVTLCAAAALVTTRATLRMRAQQVRVRHQGPLYRAAAWTGTLPREARIGTWNAGIIGYLSQRQVVNLDGLVNTRSFFEREQYDLCGYWERTGIGYVVDVFEAGSSAPIQGTAWPVTATYAACADRLQLVWTDGAPDEPDWPKAYRLLPSVAEPRGGERSGSGNERAGP